MKACPLVFISLLSALPLVAQTTAPDGNSQFRQWQIDFPIVCSQLGLDPEELDWKDRVTVIERWLRLVAANG